MIRPGLWFTQYPGNEFPTVTPSTLHSRPSCHLHDQASDLALRLSARSRQTTGPDRILYFESVEDAEGHQIPVKQEETLDTETLLDIVLRLQKKVDRLIGLIERGGHEGVFKGVGKVKASLQECLNEIQDYGINRENYAPYQVDWKREIWTGEFESLQDNVNKNWKPAVATLDPRDAPLYRVELDAILPLAKEGLVNVKSRSEARPFLSRLILDVDMAAAGTKDRKCRITFHRYREQHDPKAGRSRYSDKRTQVFTLQADSVESCCRSLLQGSSLGSYGVPSSLLSDASGEARQTFTRIGRAQEASMHTSDGSVSIWCSYPAAPGIESFISLPGRLSDSAVPRASVPKSAVDRRTGRRRRLARTYIATLECVDTEAAKLQTVEPSDYSMRGEQW